MKHQCPSSIVWSVEMRGIFLINQLTNLSIFLNYPEAMIWEMLVCKKDRDQIQKAVRLVSNMNDEQTEHFVGRTLKDWADSGWVEAIDG